MVQKKIPLLTPEESGAIMVTIGKKLLKKKDIALKLRCTRPRFSQILHRRIRMTYEMAQGLYEILDQDLAISFLYHPEDSSENPVIKNEDLSQSWQKLYDNYSNRLKQEYISQPIEEKGKILSELEKMIEKYR